jgi:hypothetical protein
LTPKIAELARQYDLITLSAKRLGQQFFIVPVIVVRRVDKVDAQIDGPMKNVDRLLLTDITKLSDKGWTAVADRGNFEALFTEITIVHLNFLPLGNKAINSAPGMANSAGNLAIRWSILRSLKDRL